MPHQCTKHINLLTGKPPGDDVKIAMLSLKPGMKIMMMGTAEENLVCGFQFAFVLFLSK